MRTTSTTHTHDPHALHINCHWYPYYCATPSRMLGDLVCSSSGSEHFPPHSTILFEFARTHVGICAMFDLNVCTHAWYAWVHEHEPCKTELMRTKLNPLRTALELEESSWKRHRVGKAEMIKIIINSERAVHQSKTIVLHSVRCSCAHSQIYTFKQVQLRWFQSEFRNGIEMTALQHAEPIQTDSRNFGNKKWIKIFQYSYNLLSRGPKIFRGSIWDKYSILLFLMASKG